MKNNLKKILSKESNVLFAYLFGSGASGCGGPLSDLDIAVYLANLQHAHEYRLCLIEKVASSLKTDNLDLIILNDAPIVLKFEVVKNGILIIDSPSPRVEFEVAVMQDYLDSAYIRSIQRTYIRQQCINGGYFGQT